jgi:hypothetical protein
VTGSGSDCGVASAGADKTLKVIVPEGYMKNPYGCNGDLVYIGGKGVHQKDQELK